MANPGWIERLRQRWKLDSIRQVIVVLIVFALYRILRLFYQKTIVTFSGRRAG